MGISSGRIIDRAGRGALPVGIENFELVAEKYTYVDKTLLARELVDNEGKAVLFCRPRRFGKSLAMRMLQCYFEAPVAEAREPIPDRSALFEGLAITDEGERYTREAGAHPVIFLSLGGAHGLTWEEVRIRIASYVADECRRHDYLMDDPEVAESDKGMLRRLMAREPEGGDLEASLAFLSRLLARHHGAGTVILVDEYDAPITEGHLRGFREKAVTFFRSWLTDALKATTSLFLGIMTGVQRVSRESIFSGLNNIVVDTPLDHRFTEAFGFTESEAEALAAHAGLEAKTDEMRDWYDGYRFGNDRVYNPWSVLSYLENDGVAQPYWGNTSSNAVVHELFLQAEGATAEELAALAAGGSVAEPIDLATVFDMIGVDPQAIWSQLYLAGYLTTNDVAEPNDADMPRRLEVPNREVRLLYRGEFAERSRLVAGNRARLLALHRALTSGDAPGAEGALRRIMLDSASARDLVAENSYHMLLLGLLYYVYGYMFPKSNDEAGDGFADVLLEPERENAGRLPSLAIELKWERAGREPLSDGELASLAQAALDQADGRSYADPLPPGPVLTWGIGFSGKRVAAVCREG